MSFVLVTQPFKNRYCILTARRIDNYRLKTPFKRGIFFYVFTVLVKCSSSYALYVASLKRRFKYV